MSETIRKSLIKEQLSLYPQANETNIDTPVSSKPLTSFLNQKSTPDSIVTLLNTLFPEQEREEKEIKQLKTILGDLADSFSVEEMHVLISEVQYLVTSWLDLYERGMLNGKTLQEVLNRG
jgi:hypothetical protein